MGSTIPHPASGGPVGAYIDNPLILPGKPVVTAPVTIAGSQQLKAGSVLGVVTATGKYKLSATNASDGSEVPIAVLGEDLDTSSGDRVFPVIVEGYLNEDALVLGENHTPDTVRLALRKVGIHIRKMSYSG